MNENLAISYQQRLFQRSALNYLPMRQMCQSENDISEKGPEQAKYLTQDMA